VLDAGAFTVRGSERRIELLSVARESGAALGEHVMNMTDVFTFPSGCHVAEVEVDPETGAAALLRYTAVDDYGRLINPMLTEGQVQGGVTQGIGQALLEHTVYDPRRPAAERLAHGLRAAARRRPAGLRHRADRAADQRQSAGRQGLGPGRLHRAPQTIMAALLDALRPAGVEAIDMPATPGEDLARPPTPSSPPRSYAGGPPPRMVRMLAGSAPLQPSFLSPRKK
jgi:carbon-monoxide dehydrogenase large subunit